MPAISAKNTSLVNVAAVSLLVLMALLMFASAWNDTFTYDETSHLAGAYGCLRKLDYRLGPQEPPLMKDLGALPLLFMDLNEPWDDPAWDRNDSGGFGRKLIFNSGNDADAMARAARVPLILFTVAFGWFLFHWSKRQFGDRTALLALFFYTFSPTFLAHGRIVATDVGAAAGFFVGIVGLLRFLKDPSRQNVGLAGLAFAFACLTKYSSFLLLPVTGILTVAWVYAHEESETQNRVLIRYFKLTSAVFLIAFIAIYPIYLHHTWNYPPERQMAATEYILGEFGLPEFPRGVAAWASHNPAVRPWAEVLLGVVATYVGSAFAGNRYFFGTIHSEGLAAYFPFVYLVKEPLAMHLLSLVALFFAIAGIRRIRGWRDWLQTNFVLVAFLVVIVCYWGMALHAQLNIGVRHLLPTFAFGYVLIAHGVSELYRRLQRPSDHSHSRLSGTRRASSRARRWIAPLTLGALLAWQMVSVLRVHPSYLAYFNELAGGPGGGWRYVVDSNIDWGQDLKRLSRFVEQRDISRIQLDYFGTADPAYYLQEKFTGLSGCSDSQKGWLSVSVMSYQMSRQSPDCDYRRWLPMERRVTTIGYSIFVFHID